MLTPGLVLDLLLDQVTEINAFIERIGFRSRVADPALVVKVFSNLVKVSRITEFSDPFMNHLHHPLTIHA